MTALGDSDGLLALSKGSGERAAVVLHGIRQTREDLRNFAGMIGHHLPGGLDLYLYGYNHTAGLAYNGEKLLFALSALRARRIDLVGYSMGGLVSRLAASETWPSRIHTVVTIATPNRGSMSNAELTMLGQLGRSIFEFISPLAPRSEGVKDLTRVVSIMGDRREEFLNRVEHRPPTAAERRYASIPALFYNDDRPEFEFGPSIVLTGVQAGIKLVGLKVRLIRMERAHDGIVTERSNNLSLGEAGDFSEVHLTGPTNDGSPAICHAVVDTCRNHDHSSILSDPRVAHLAAALISTDDWRCMRTVDPVMRLRARLYPFDAN